MNFLRKIFKFFLVLSFLTILGCTKYTNLSDDKRIVVYKFFNEEKSYIEKFDNKTNEWFRAKCENATKNILECIDDIEFTDLSQSQIELLLNSEKNNKENIQLNSQTTNTSKEESNEEEEEEGEEEEEEDEEEEPECEIDCS